MKTITKLLILLMGLSILSCSKSNRDAEVIARGDIAGAEKVLGLEFEAWEIDTMHSYLERNLRGYDSMRSRKLPLGTSPAVIFNPQPANFKVDLGEGIRVWPDADIERPAIDSELAFLSLSELGHLIKTRQITIVELTNFYLSRLKKYDDSLMAVVSYTEERALEQAKTLDKEIDEGHYRGPLHGIPYGVKDLASVEGYPTTWGAKPYENQQIEQTATIVSKLDDAGAVLIAKLTSGALARGDVWFGGKTKNPWDLKQGASGSSAGSGSAVSAGLVPFAIGTETLGSIVSPSTRCGVTGFRPSFGLVSRGGIMTLSWSMDKVGPIAGNAIDCALVFDAIRGSDPADPSSIDFGFNFETGKKGIQDYKIAYFKQLFDNDSTERGDLNRNALEKFQELGAELIPIELPENYPYNSFDIILRAEAGAFFDDLVKSHGDREMVEQHRGSRANSLRQSRFIPAVEYIQANRFRYQLIQEFNELIQPFDVVLTPTFGGRQLLITNLTGHPAISVPSGFDEENHPVSFTILSNLYDDGKILEVANIYQSNTDHHLKHPEWVLE